MTFSPVHSPYPGKYVMMAFAALLAFGIFRSLRFALRAGKQERENASRGLAIKPDPKRDPRANFGFAVLLAVLLAFVIAAIVAGWPN